MNDRLLSPGEVAETFGVHPKTVTRWAKSGKIRAIRTPGGHRRYKEADVRAFLEGIDRVRTIETPWWDKD